MNMSSCEGLVVGHLADFGHNSTELARAGGMDAEAYQGYKPLRVVLYCCWC